MSEGDDGRRRNWPNRENRIRQRTLAKRVSPEDHEVVVAYARFLDVTVSDLLEPAVEELVGQARAFVAMTTEDASDQADYRDVGR